MVSMVMSKEATKPCKSAKFHFLAGSRRGVIQRPLNQHPPGWALGPRTSSAFLGVTKTV